MFKGGGCEGERGTWGEVVGVAGGREGGGERPRAKGGGEGCMAIRERERERAKERKEGKKARQQAHP